MNNAIKFRLIACGIISLMILGTMVVIGKTVDVRQEPAAGVKMELPDEIVGWRGFPARVSEVERDILGQDTEFARKFYVAPGGKQGFFLSIVLSGKDRTSIHPPEMCLRGQGWQFEPKSEVIEVRISEPRPYKLKVMKLVVYREDPDAKGKPTEQKLIYLYWFVGKDILTPVKNYMTFRESWDRLVYGKSHRWAYVTLAANTSSGDEDSTLKLMKIFLEGAVPKFQLFVPEGE